MLPRSATSAHSQHLENSVRTQGGSGRCRVAKPALLLSPLGETGGQAADTLRTPVRTVDAPPPHVAAQTGECGTHARTEEVPRKIRRCWKNRGGLRSRPDVESTVSASAGTGFDRPSSRSHEPHNRVHQALFVVPRTLQTAAVTRNLA